MTIKTIIQKLFQRDSHLGMPSAIPDNSIDWAALADAIQPHLKYLPYWVRECNLSRGDMDAIAYTHSAATWAAFFYENAELLTRKIGKTQNTVNCVMTAIVALAIIAEDKGVAL